MGWTFPWVSSLGSDFNGDFQATLDAVTPPIYTYRPVDPAAQAETPGVSVFLRDGEDI